MLVTGHWLPDAKNGRAKRFPSFVIPKSGLIRWRKSDCMKKMNSKTGGEEGKLK
jgi:hypothetical protein